MSERKEGDKQSNGRHILREAYAVKREKQMAGVVSRKIIRAQLTPYEQMEVLDGRLGKFIGAKKERARLALKEYDGMGSGGQELYPLTRAQLVQELEIAKMESRGFRIMRRLGLAPRTPIDYDSERVAREWIACVRARVGYRT